MPTIKVELGKLSQLESQLSRIPGKINSAESVVNSVRRGLDWDIACEASIDRKLRNIASALNDSESRMKKTAQFMGDAVQWYSQTEQKNIALMDKSSESIKPRAIREAEELEHRKNTANIINWTVTIGCVVGSIAIIAATGGMAAPAVFGVMVATSTVTGTLTSATNNLTAQYVEDGFADGVDMHSLGTEVAVGTVSGLIGGVISGGMGAGATALTTKATSSALVSSNSARRILTAAGINSIAEVAEGSIRDGAVTLFESGGDLETAWNAASDVEERVKDGAIGFVVGGGSEGLKIAKQHHINEMHKANIQAAKNKAQDVVDNAASNYTKKHAVSVIEAEHRAGLKNIKQATNGSADFGESDYILRNNAGEAASFKIKAIGDKSAEKDEIKTLLENGGFKDVLDDPKYTIHRLADLDTNTEEFTVQIVETNAKKAFDKARGSYASAEMQYKVMHGGGYGKDVDRTAAAYIKPKVPERNDPIDLPGFVGAFADGLDLVP